MINFLQSNRDFDFFDKKIIKYLLNNMKIYNDKSIIIDMIDLKKLLNKFSNKDIMQYLNHTQNLQIFYRIISNKTEYEGNFSIISGYKIINFNKIEISFSDDFINLFDKNSFISEINLDIFLSFNFFYSIHLYNFIVNELAFNSSVEIELSKLKEILHIKNQYSRIYDFEKYVLIPALNEINKISDLNFYYIKIKKSNKTNSKVVGFNFFTLTKNKIEEIKKVLQFFKIKKDYNIFIYKISEILDLFSVNGLTEIIHALKSEYEKIKVENKPDYERYFFENIDTYIDERKNNYILITDINDVSSFNQYKSLILENSYQIDLSFLFTWNEVINIKRNEIFEYENNILKIKAKYFDKGEKYIQIFKKK